MLQIGQRTLMGWTNILVTVISFGLSGASWDATPSRALEASFLAPVEDVFESVLDVDEGIEILVQVCF